jgi:Na+-driven multidrug efflux pump
MAAYPILNLSLSVIFIQLWGLLGVALATTATYFLAETVFIYFISRIFDLSLSRIIWSCHLPVLAILTPAVVVSLQYKALVVQQSWSSLVVGVLIFTVCFSAALLTYGLFGAERDRIRAMAAKLIPRPA